MTAESAGNRFASGFGNEEISTGYKQIVPFVATLVLSLLMLLPVGTGLGGAALPHFTLISVFYFLSRRPLTMPYGLCALCGLLLDLWLAVPLGLNMLLCVLTRLFVINQLKYYKGRSRLVHWGVFSFLTFLLFLLSYLFLSFWRDALLPVAPVALQWLVTVLAFGPVAFVLGIIRRRLM